MVYWVRRFSKTIIGFGGIPFLGKKGQVNSGKKSLCSVSE